MQRGYNSMVSFLNANTPYGKWETLFRVDDSYVSRLLKY